MQRFSLHLSLAGLLALAQPLAAGETIPVQARPLAELAVHAEYRAPASVVSDGDSRISAEIMARIVELPVHVGEVVKQGALLARLEATDHRLALDREEAALRALQARVDLAAYQLDRARSLSRKNVVSEELLTQRETELRSLRAQLEGQEAAVTQARRRLAKTAVRAPFEAVIDARLASVGELASPGTPLLQIIDYRRLEVSVPLQARLAESLPRAERPELVTPVGRYPLRLRTITPAFDPVSRTREARLLFTGEAALPGSAGELVWRSTRPELPAELLSRRKGSLGVFVVDTQDGATRARFVPLPGAEEGRPAAVSLPARTLVITLGRFRLQDGDPVSLRQP